MAARPPRTPDEILAGLAAGTVRRCFVLAHEAFYASANPKVGTETGREIVAELRLCTDGCDDGTVAEFPITEHRAGPGPNHWRASLFDDAWVLFAVEPRIFEGLATLGEDATFKQIVELFDRLGYADATERKDPR